MRYKHVALVAVSGTGKGTVTTSLKAILPNLTTSTSATTRKPRSGEVHGVHYYFFSRIYFLLLVFLRRFVEWFPYNKNLYGTLRSEVKKKEKAGQIIVFDVEINGAMRLKKNLGDRLLVVFLDCPIEECEKRLRGRGTESEDYIQNRLRIGREKEIPRKNECDEVVWYGQGADPDLTANTIVNLMIAA